MIFEWDHEKSEKTRRERGFPFSYAVGIFDDLTIEYEDRREDYGEVRIVALGCIAGRVFVVVFTDREPGSRRIISAWPAGKQETAIWRRYVGL